ncbi:hypothetical protein AB0N89_21475 [Amycolatopsis sp. NPDC089917]|uniref:effector-associated constant component EACC1 n=1 Tax=Amycolatopsis sp. NPDC089917 TaxID=3155187 RepID=UPI003441EA16
MTGSTVLITVEGEDDALALRAWLNAEDDLRGRVTMHRQPMPEHAMGQVLDTVSVVLTSGGIGAVTTSLVAYLRTRGMKVKITAKVGDRTATIEGERLSKAALHELNEAATAMAKQLGESQAP